jgi:hypothetical protein
MRGSIVDVMKRTCRAGASVRGAIGVLVVSTQFMAPAAAGAQHVPVSSTDAERQVYALAQAGRYADAAGIVEGLDAGAAGSAAVAALRLRLLLERRAWDQVLSAFHGSSGHLASYAVGLAAARTSRSGHADPFLALARRMLASLEGAARQAGRRSVVEIQRLSVQAAVAAALEEREEMALVLAHAIDLERGLEHDGMPVVPIPVRELAGDLWLDVDRERDARREYAASLAAFPERARSLLGLARASAAAGDAWLAKDAYRTFLARWVDADRGQDEVREAATYLGFIMP